MKKIFSFFRRGWMQRSLYLLLIGALIVASIYQIYTLWSRMNTRSADPYVSFRFEPDTTASLLEPYAMYLTADGESYARMTSLSGHYKAGWSAAKTLLNRMAKTSMTYEEIIEEELPDDQAGLVLYYVAPLTERAVRENLSLELPGCAIDEIFILPAISRQDRPTLYLIDWSAERFYKAQSEVTASYAASSAFNNQLWDLSAKVKAEYLNVHQRFPGSFHGHIYSLQQEFSQMYYFPEISVSFLNDGVLDAEAATQYVMHFFSYPDVAHEVEASETAIWYADEKRTVRYDEGGRLQYVATQEPAEKEPVNLTEAYQLAAGFLGEDLRQDPTLLQEVYLCGYEVGDNEYTFYWNYSYNHIPFAMSEKSRTWTAQEAPIEIIVQGSQVRYYHRYMLNKTMEADRIFRVQGSYIDALNLLYEEEPNPGDRRITGLSLEYAEEEDGELALSWRLEYETEGEDGENQVVWIPAEEVRI